ncbi:MAG: DinB family protein [Balneolaceae bacterium]
MQKLLITQFDLHHRLYNNVLSGFTDRETNQRLEGYGQMNHVKYLAGHLLNSQYGLGMLAGINPKVKWNELFAVMGKSEARDQYNYPDIEEVKTEWNQMHDGMREGLAKLTDESLNKKPPAPFDQVADTAGNLWAFINHHQAYHIGQIAILRRGFGKEPMSYQ